MEIQTNKDRHVAYSECHTTLCTEASMNHTTAPSTVTATVDSKEHFVKLVTLFVMWV